MDFIAFDLETTGTVPGVDRIVELGAVKYVGGKIDSLFVTLVNPGVSIPKVASDINGITDDMVANQPSIDSVLSPFAEFCGDSMMVAHNAPFDVQFLVSDIKRHQSRAPRGTILDTCSISRKVFPGLANYKLGTLVQNLKIPSNAFHRAEADATYCGNLFLKIVERVATGGLPPKLEQLIALTGKPELRFPQIQRQPTQLALADFL